jgi:hypothetical protein
MTKFICIDNCIFMWMKLQTPVWGGSTESMTTSKFNCPLKERTGCEESIICNTLMDHLSGQHSGPLIHFYSKNISLPVPFPFQGEAVYILHHKDENFILLVLSFKFLLSLVMSM